ncbi:MAG: Uma2 family endonuclease [Gammaproteobacteria bacterium]
MSTVTARAPEWTLDEFLAWEREQPERHEFIGGRIYAMTSPRLGHGRKVRALARALEEQLSPPCEVFTEAYLLAAGENAQRPDVMVLCSEPDDDATEARDAELVVEVLSPSNRPGEMEAKREAYLTLPSLVASPVVDGEEYENRTSVPGGTWQRQIMRPGEFSVELHGREIRL